MLPELSTTSQPWRRGSSASPCRSSTAGVWGRGTMAPALSAGNTWKIMSGAGPRTTSEYTMQPLTSSPPGR